MAAVVAPLLLALAAAAAGTPGASWSAVPRRTVPYEELQDTARRFSQGGVSHYLTLTLDEAEALLYVGAREAVFALATGTVELKAAISWEAPVEKKAECVQKGKNNQTDCFNYVRFLQSYNSSHLYACGTYAFQPKCTYIELSGFTLDPVAFEDGKGKCPYDPTKGHTGLIVDGELYSATFNNFLGTEPVILRNLGPHYSVKTEYLTSWLNEPHFVASAFVPESAGSSGDDDKVYFFFSERAVEYDCYAEQVVARVARVCKGDVGGARTLQKKWTSFLKARLVCSAPEQQLHFNRLQAVFTLPGARWQDTAFFGVFQARCDCGGLVPVAVVVFIWWPWWSCPSDCGGLVPVAVVVFIWWPWWPCPSDCGGLVPVAVVVFIWWPWWFCPFAHGGLDLVAMVALISWPWWPCPSDCGGLDLVAVVVLSQCPCAHGVRARGAPVLMPMVPLSWCPGAHGVPVLVPMVFLPWCPWCPCPGALVAVVSLPGAHCATCCARRGDVDVSAICRYPILEVRKAFEGPYKEYREQAQKWGRYSGEVPTPRPGACITDWHRQNGFASSLELPDNTLNFAKKHPLMDQPVPPQRGRPLLLKRDANFTQLVVDRVAGLDGATYEVLFIGTGDGWVHKALDLGTRTHLVEELQVFEPPQPVESLVLAGTKVSVPGGRRRRRGTGGGARLTPALPWQKLLFAGSRLQVAQLPLAECGRYRSCTDCVLARDPYCAWSRNGSACVRADGHNGSHLVQDVLSSDTGACSVPQVAKQGPLTPKNVTVVAGTDLVLTCRLASNLARALWTFEGRALAAQQALLPGEARLRALVVPGAGAQHSGTYRCLAEEQGARLPAQEYRVAVLPGPGAPLETRAPPQGLGAVWALAVCLGALCLLLLLAVLSLWRRLRRELGKGAKAIESTLVYPIELPKEPPSPRFVPSAASDSDEKLWDPASYYYSDGSLKIVPGHAGAAGAARCRNGAASPPAAVPGQPLHSPTRIHLGALRGSASNGYIRLALGAEERPACADLAEELRRKLQQRQPLPDSNPEESSV
ncbi:Semaphorin-4C [Lonchura striata]|uniref:Semaphorin-4C n=1 Tax=Lonchura striata TaxID=40157 RepID=A0A218UD63_9PASE|nr:Semaphorin-4C [Lonchura striata domestica]